MVPSNRAATMLPCRTATAETGTLDDEMVAATETRVGDNTSHTVI